MDENIMWILRNFGGSLAYNDISGVHSFFMVFERTGSLRGVSHYLVLALYVICYMLSVVQGYLFIYKLYLSVAKRYIIIYSQPTIITAWTDFQETKLHTISNSSFQTIKSTLKSTPLGIRTLYTDLRRLWTYKALRSAEGWKHRLI